MQHARSRLSLVAFMSAVGTAMLVMACLPAARAVEPVRAGQEAFITRALFAEGRLWLLSDAGVLSSLEPTAEKRVVEQLAGPALDLCLLGGEPQIIANGDAANWMVRARDAQGTWSERTTVARQGDSLLAMTCSGDTTTLLTTRRLIEFDLGKASRTVPLKDALPRGLVSATYRDGGALYVGINGGEWGGGLQRIDRFSGAMASIENRTGGLCGGLLNAECDPVQGIAAEPWNPRCFAAAVGLNHLFVAQGRIVEVCGDNVRLLYAKPLADASIKPSKGSLPEQSVPFYGLVVSGGFLWAAGTDGIYRIDASGKASILPLPSFKTIDGIEVSFDQPEVVLVMTLVNARQSVGGPAPMLVTR